MPVSITSYQNYKKLFPRGWNIHSQLPKHKVFQFRRRQRTLKLSFDCEECGNTWTSVKGTVEFHLWFDNSSANIYVCLFSQKCRDCDRWAFPKIYKDQFVDILNNVIQKYLVPTETAQIERKPSANPTAEHRRDLCEACAHGVCQIADTQNSFETYNGEEEYDENSEDEYSEESYGEEYSDDEEYSNEDTVSTYVPPKQQTSFKQENPTNVWNRQPHSVKHEQPTSVFKKQPVTSHPPVKVSTPVMQTSTGTQHSISSEAPNPQPECTGCIVI